MINKIATWRLILGNKLILFWLDYRINGRLSTYLMYSLFKLLVRNAYVQDYTKANHHYIPKFLLKKFAIPSTGNIYQYTDGEPPRPVSIEKDAAHEPNLYSFRDKKTKLPSDFLEKQVFAYTLEKYASRIINRILKDNNEEIDLIYLEESILASFVAFQYVRTPKFLEYVRLVLEYLHLHKSVSLEEFSRPGFYRACFFDNNYNISLSEFSSFTLSNRLSMRGLENFVLAIVSRVGNDLSEPIFRRDLRFLHAIEPAFFFLSDNPAEIYDVNLQRSVGPFLWELKNNPLIFLPLSKNCCLYYLRSGAVVSPGTIGTIIKKALPDSIYKFAFAEREAQYITEAFIRRRAMVASSKN